MHLLTQSSNVHNGQSWADLSQELNMDLHHGCRGPNRWAILHCFLIFDSGELDEKWNIRDSNWFSYGMLELQMVLLSTTLQCWPPAYMFLLPLNCLCYRNSKHVLCLKIKPGQQTQIRLPQTALDICVSIMCTDDVINFGFSG